MKTFHPVDPKTGTAAYWEIQEPSAVTIETDQFANRSGLSVKLQNAGGVGMVESFGKDGFVAIVLPTGSWQYERSDDGHRWSKVTILDSFPGRPNAVVNLILDGPQTPYPRVWGRYTKITKPGQSSSSSSKKV